jgi:hypothetical protein
MAVEALDNSMECAFCVIDPGLIPPGAQPQIPVVPEPAPLLPYSSKPLRRNGFDEGAALPLLPPVVPLTVGC